MQACTLKHELGFPICPKPRPQGAKTSLIEAGIEPQSTPSRVQSAAILYAHEL